tara:strand:- start:208 stop:963 length:756 start_codon:yes stop_codon:yes gene_type:complete
MSLKTILSNIKHHKLEIKTCRNQLLDILYDIEDNIYLKPYSKNIKDLINNINYLSISENFNIEIINRRLNNYYDEIETYSSINKLKVYKPIFIDDIFFSSLLYRNTTKLYNWYYEIRLLKSNKPLKNFITTTNIGLPIELNTIIAGFIPKYSSLDIIINLSLDKNTQNNPLHNKKFLWDFYEIKSNMWDIDAPKIQKCIKSIKMKLSDYNFSTNIYLCNRLNNTLKEKIKYTDETDIVEDLIKSLEQINTV